MKIKSLFTCMMVSLVTILPLQAQVGKEMKAFRNKDGITVTMLNPSLYSLYKQGDSVPTRGRGFERHKRNQRDAS